MAPAPPSSDKPPCSCPPSNSNASTQTPDYLTVNIKIAHPQDTTRIHPIRTPSPNQHPTPENDTGTRSPRAHQIPEPTPTVPSTLHSIVSHLSTQTATIELLSSHLNRLEAAQASSCETQLKQVRLSKKQHERLMAKVDGVEGILACIHDEFHGEGGLEEQDQHQGTQKKMCERMEKLVVWVWSEIVEMRKGVDGKMGRVEEKIERVVGLLGERGGEEGKEG